MVPFASYVSRSKSKSRLIFSGINGSNVARQVKRKCCQYYLTFSKKFLKDLWKCIFLLKRIDIDTIPIKVCVFCNAYLGKLSTIMTWQIPCMISNCQEPILVKQTIYRFYNNCLFLFLFRMIYYPTSSGFSGTKKTLLAG